MALYILKTFSVVLQEYPVSEFFSRCSNQAGVAVNPVQ
jgi:hypothetical protein